MEGKTSQINRFSKTAKLFVIFLVTVSLLAFLPAPKAKADVAYSDADQLATRRLLNTHNFYFVSHSARLTYQNRTYSPALYDMGIYLDIDTTMNNLIAQAQSLGETDLRAYTSGLLRARTAPLAVSVNDATFNAYFERISTTIPTRPVNARLAITNGQVIYIAGKPGAVFDSVVNKPAITSVLTQNLFGPIPLATTLQNPAIQEDQTLSAHTLADGWLDSQASLRVIYRHTRRTRHDRTYTASRTTIGSWIYFVESNGQIEARLSKTRISRWLSSTSKKVYIGPKRNLVSYGSGHRQVLIRGYSGQRLTTTGFADQIYTNILAAVPTALEKTNTLIRAKDNIVGGIVAGRYRGKYIEVSLSQQRMYVFKGSRLLHIFRISSGRPGLATPTGKFRIRDKRPWNACRPSPEYSSCWMPKTMHFTSQGHAFHALPIINGRQEGLWHLGIPVSHGCVRLGPPQAAYLYRWAYIGMPVIIHR